MTPRAEMTKAAWRAEGARRFGPDVMAWRFRCPACGAVATPRDFRAAGRAEDAAALATLVCFAGCHDPGRFDPARPTNRDLTILHTLRSPDVVWVWTGDATSVPSLPFADPESEVP